MKKQQALLFALLPYILLLSGIFLSLRAGTVSIPFFSFLPNHEPAVENIIFWHRFYRILAAFLAGAILSLCGAVLQTLFHNPLVSPFTMGISGTASLGATIAYITGWNWQWKFFNSLQLSAFVFALICLTGMLAFARRRRADFLLHFVLVGIVLNILSGSFILFLRYISDPYEYMIVDRWLMGSVHVLDFQSLIPMLGIFIICLFYFLSAHIKLDILAYGEEIAHSRGIEVFRFQNGCIIMSALAVSIVVATCGIISFIGLIVPHIIKLFGIYHHKTLLHLSVLYGGLFLIIADTLARTLLSPLELPVGILTSIVGGTIFFVLLLKGFRQV